MVVVAGPEVLVVDALQTADEWCDKCREEGGRRSVAGAHDKDELVVLQGALFQMADECCCKYREERERRSVADVHDDDKLGGLQGACAPCHCE